MLKTRKCSLAVLAVALMAALTVAAPAAFAADDGIDLTAGVTTQATTADSAAAGEVPADQAYTKATTRLDINTSKGWVVANGTYFIVSNKDSSQVLGLSKHNAVMTAKTGAKAQKWKFKFDYDSQTYTITNAKTGKVLTAAKKAKAGAKVYESKLVKKSQYLTRYATRTIAIPTQRWILVSNKFGYGFISAQNNNVMIDVSSGSAKLVKKSKVKQSRFWTVGASGTFASNGIANGTYVMSSAVNNKLLNVTKSSVKNKAGLSVGSARTKWGEMFDFKYYGNGYYKIYNYNSGKLLRAYNGSKIVQYDYKKKAGANQLWKANVVGSDGAVQFVNKATGKALAFNGSKVVLEAAAKATAEAPIPASQRWVISPTTTGLTDTGKKALYRMNKETSSTRWCIAIDMGVHEFFLFQKAKASQKGAPWVLNDTCRCATGAGRGTAACTVTTGYMSVTHPTINARWCIWVKNGSFLHSILYGGGGNEQLGWNISHGCIRIPFSNAEHVYNTIKPGTKMVRWYKL